MKNINQGSAGKNSAGGLMPLVVKPAARTVDPVRAASAAATADARARFDCNPTATARDYSGSHNIEQAVAANKKK